MEESLQSLNNLRVHKFVHHLCLILMAQVTREFLLVEEL